MLPSLDYKPNLYDIDDMEIEEFRDFLTDMFYGDKKFMEKGYTKDFGHENQLETVSHTPIPSNLLDSKFLNYLREDALEKNLTISDVEFIHSKFYLHTQAREFLKIDIISCRILKPNPTISSLDPLDLSPVALYYEEGDNDEVYTSDSGEKGTFYEGHSLWEKNEKYDKQDLTFDPRESGYWEEWLRDFGIN